MNCKDLEELISAYADGELSRTQREFIEEHLSGCAGCRAVLAEYKAAGRLLAKLGEMPTAPDIKEAALSKIKVAGTLPGSFFHRRLRPVMVGAAAVIILALFLVTQPWVMKSPEALATSIVRNSPEVQAFFDDEQIEEVEVTTKVIGNEGDVLVVLVKTETRTAAAEVNLKKKVVTDIVRVRVPEFQPGDEQKALDIAKADAGVQELLAQGGVFGEIHLAYSIDITQVTGPDGIVRKEGTARPTAFLSVDLKGKAWSVAVDLDEAKVVGIGKPSAAMLVADWSHIAFTILNPLMALLGIIIIVGLALRNRLAGRTTGITSIVFGVLALYGGLYAWPGGRGSQFLALSVPVLVLVMGIAAIRTRVINRWISITGLVLGFLALALDSISLIAYPDRDIWVVFVIAVVIAGIFAYALYDQIRKIPRRWWRPALFVFTAAVFLILAIVQPWSSPLEPESVMARAYAATEGLQSYRLTYSGTTTVDGKTTFHFMEVAFAAPDRYHITMTSDDQTDEFIIIGDTQYVTSGTFGRYATVALSDSFSSILSKEATLNLLNELTGLKVLPEETIDGVRCLHYLGKWDVEKRIEETRQNIRESNEKSGAPDFTDEELEEMFEQMRSIDVTYEYWIGKNDSLIRRIKTEQRGPADKNGLLSVSMTTNFTDFNRTITIEPPLDADGNLLEGWRLAGSVMAGSKQPVFGRNITSSIGAREGYEDWEHQEVRYTITITNNSIETVKDVRLTITTMLTDEAIKPATMDVEPETPAEAVGPGESLTYQARIPFDASDYTKEEILELNRDTIIYVHFTTEDGQELTELLFADAPYPQKTPPATPPE